MKKSWVKTWWKIDHFFERHRALVFLVVLVVVLRIPSYFEPYWYGDEAIYLTVGEGINQGKTLYRDIVDHKTPIIYYLARVPSQLSFRILLTLWMIPASIALFYLANQLVKHRRVAWLVSSVFVVFTSMPTFEGLIPNGELFVIGFILPGLAWLYRTLKVQQKHPIPTFSRSTLKQPQQLLTTLLQIYPPKMRLELVGIGVLFGCALLTKVPAVFDVASALLLVPFVVLAQVNHSLSRKYLLKIGARLVSVYVWLVIGILLPLLLSLIYFTLKGALTDYIQFGLLYNFHYAGTWNPNSFVPFSTIFFSLWGKLLILLVVASIAILSRKYFAPLLSFSFVWFWWALIAASLSNRPYPHYFIQVLPALVLFCIALAQSYRLSLHNPRKMRVSALVPTLLMGIFSFAFLLYVNGVLELWSHRYSALEYYQTFSHLVSGKISAAEYANSFNPLVADNQTATQYMQQTRPKEFYIWGTNPMLYAQNHATPPDKFVVLFHVADLEVYDETINAVSSGSPEYIVVMKDAETVPTRLRRYIDNNYIPKLDLPSLILWERRQLSQ